MSTPFVTVHILGDLASVRFQQTYTKPIGSPAAADAVLPPAAMCYLMLPERPAGTEGWTQEQLGAIVTGIAW